jgi:hypothetical protein
VFCEGGKRAKVAPDNLIQYWKCSIASSGLREAREHSVARNGNEHNMESGVLHFLRVLQIDLLFECLQIFVRASMLCVIDDVVLRFGIGDERADVAAFQHSVNIAGPGRYLEGGGRGRL